MTDKLDSEARMTIKSLAGRGHSNRAVARLLGVHEHAVRYHLRRQATGATDGRTRQAHRAEPYAEAIAHWLEHRDPDGPVNLAALHDWLVAEHGYPVSLLSKYSPNLPK
jgi:IS30 family transposase